MGDDDAYDDIGELTKQPQQSQQSGAKSLDGLGGWLILVGLGVVLAPVRLLLQLVPIYSGIFATGVWTQISTPGSGVYNPALKWFIGGELVFNILMISAAIYLIYLFFAKHQRFPKLYIAIIVVSLLMVPLDAVVGSWLIPNTPVWDPQTTRDFARSALVAVIWIPYMLVSKRVKATFRDRSLDVTAQTPAASELPEAQGGG